MRRFARLLEVLGASCGYVLMITIRVFSRGPLVTKGQSSTSRIDASPRYKFRSCLRCVLRALAIKHLVDTMPVITGLAQTRGSLTNEKKQLVQFSDFISFQGLLCPLLRIFLPHHRCLSSAVVNLSLHFFDSWNLILILSSPVDRI